MAIQLRDTGKPLKRFLVFAYSYYNPGGGWGHFHGSMDTQEEISQFPFHMCTENSEPDGTTIGCWCDYQVVDSYDGVVVSPPRSIVPDRPSHVS